MPDVPELFTSNDALFTVLANGTVPAFTLLQEDFGSCDIEIGMSDEILTPNLAGAEDYQPGGVNVIASATVGPYETVVLQATGADYLVDWLDDQGFAVPSDIGPVLAPYLADHQYFVALKLASDKDAGDLAPLGMTYCGGAASIPIQLTSIAAVDDLPIEAFVLGPSRAVPDNYLHVRINEAAIDWYAGGTNYRDVVMRAADEAGGQAFATDFSGGTSMFAGRVWNDTMLDLDSLRNAQSSIEWLENILFSGLPSSSQLTALVTEWAPAPIGVDQAAFLQCPSCYDYLASGPFDAMAATDALETEIVDVLDEAQALIDRSPHLTRLFTTMDPSEMTVDPQFVFNRDIEQQLAFTHTATNERHCGLFEGFENSERVLRLEDGRSIESALRDLDGAQRDDRARVHGRSHVSGRAGDRGPRRVRRGNDHRRLPGRGSRRSSELRPRMRVRDGEWPLARRGFGLARRSGCAAASVSGVIRAGLAVALLSFLPKPALACGGMFCDAVQPVDQAAERIVFAWAEGVDACPDGQITVEVQIAYEGDADDFAWVVPVPDVPELFVSNDALFNVLANATLPSFALLEDQQGTCEQGLFAPNRDADSAGAGAGEDYQQGGVNVIASETVGPYETVVLQATGADVLLDWLDEQGFAVPSDIGPVVAPYLADHQYFVALKLGSNKDAGDLAPLGMTYCGDAASIPIQLTSIASVDDLPIEVFVLGPTRAVPDNYLHVRINEAAIDWYGGGLELPRRRETGGGRSGRAKRS